MIRRKLIKYITLNVVHITTIVTVSLPILMVLYLGSLSWQSIYHTKIWVPQDTQEQNDISILLDQSILNIEAVSNSWQNSNSRINQQYHHPRDDLLSTEEKKTLETWGKKGFVKQGFNTRLISRGNSRYPEQSGLLAGFLGSLIMIITVAVISIPIGFTVAVYFTEFASKSWFNYLLELIVYNLSSVPSIIFGLWGFVFLIKPELLEQTSYLTASVVISALILPMIIIAAKNALHTVPKTIRHASLALGASRTETALYLVLPAALPRMFSGVIVALARALGEVAPLIFIGMTAFVINTEQNLTRPATVLPAQIYLWAMSPETAFWSVAAAGTLLIIALLLIIAVILIRIQNSIETRN